MQPVLAHVTYVTPPAGGDRSLGDLVAALLADPGALVLLTVGALAIGAAALLDVLVRPALGPRVAFAARARTYLGLVPWMLRLSLGLPLLGAGVLGYAFAPDVRIAGFPTTLLTVLGFLLLLGLGSRLAAGVALGAWLVAFVLEPHLLEVVEMAALAVAILLVGGGVPSADDLVSASLDRDARVRAPMTDDADATDGPLSPPVPDLRPRLDQVALVVRAGLGLSLASAGLTEKLLDPGRAALAVEKYGLTNVVPVSESLWIAGAGLTETALGLAILAGAWTRPAALLGFGVLSLTLFALPDDPVLAHVSLFGACSVLVVTGGGRWSVDALLSRLARPRRAPATRLRAASGV